MRRMDEQRITRLEARLESLVEGVFAQLFARKVLAQDLALQLVRVLEENLLTGLDRPTAPDLFMIYMSPETHARLLERQPTLAQILSRYIVDIVAEADYRLQREPLVKIIADSVLESRQIVVKAEHSETTHSSTGVMHNNPPPRSNAVFNSPDAHLLIDGERSLPLNHNVVNIGRSHDNELIIDNPFVSRHHAQLRLRFGRYTLFDTQSQGGVFVNEVRIREHTLQTGDVIRIGDSRIIYIEDSHHDDAGSNTAAFDPVD